MLVRGTLSKRVSNEVSVQDTAHRREDCFADRRCVVVKGEGRVVVIAGPDGVGKSTLSQALVAHLSLDRAVKTYHQRASALPVRTNAPVTVPHGAKPYSGFVSLAKTAYLFADVTLGWLFRVRPFVRRGGWVVIERGSWDFAVDPARYRIALPSWFLRSVVGLLPRPNVIAILEVPAEEAARRKAELPNGEFTRQAAAWRAVRPATNVVYLDATRPVSDLVCQVMAALER